MLIATKANCNEDCSQVMCNIRTRLNTEAARGSWLAVLLGVQSMDWGGGGGGGGAWEPAQAPSKLPITLHTGPCIDDDENLKITGYNEHFINNR